MVKITLRSLMLIALGSLCTKPVVAMHNPKSSVDEAEANARFLIFQLNQPADSAQAAVQTIPAQTTAVASAAPSTPITTAFTSMVTASCDDSDDESERKIIAEKAFDTMTQTAKDAKLLQLMKSGRFEEAEKVLLAGANVNAVDRSGDTALMHAVNQGNEKMVTMLLNRKDTDLYALNKAGDGVLHHAVNNGDVMMVDLLINAGINVNSVDGDGWSALQRALSSLNQNQAVIERLLNTKGIDLDNRNMHNDTALHHCFYHGDIDNFKLLIAFGADPETVQLFAHAPDLSHGNKAAMQNILADIDHFDDYLTDEDKKYIDEVRKLQNFNKLRLQAFKKYNNASKASVFKIVQNRQIGQKGNFVLKSHRQSAENKK